jgi:hypothetical protein
MAREKIVTTGSAFGGVEAMPIDQAAVAEAAAVKAAAAAADSAPAPSVGEARATLAAQRAALATSVPTPAPAAAPAAASAPAPAAVSAAAPAAAQTRNVSATSTAPVASQISAGRGTVFNPSLTIPGYANMPFNTQKAILLDAVKAGFNVEEAAAKAGIDLNKENASAQNAEWNNRIKAINRYSPEVSSRAINNMQTLAQIANSADGRAIFGQLQARDIDDVISRAAKAAGSIIEQGVNVGHFGTANVDVTNIVSNLNLNDYQKKLAARALNAIAEETVANLSLNREAIGGRLSNYEDKQLSAAIISAGSVPEAIYYWAHKRLVQHGQESKVYDAFNKYDMSNPGLLAQDPKRFFRDPKSGYEDLNKRYFQALTGLDKILIRK